MSEQQPNLELILQQHQQQIEILKKTIKELSDAKEAATKNPTSIKVPLLKDSVAYIDQKFNLNLIRAKSPNSQQLLAELRDHSTPDLPSSRSVPETSHFNSES
ncbi:hypothetical protein HDU92_000382, partial [Lobulomyces angularis]